MRRQATEGDIPAIAHYLGINCATVIRRYTTSDLTVLKTDGKVTALWKGVRKKFFEQIRVRTTSKERRLSALDEINDLSLRTLLSGWTWGSDPGYWKGMLKQNIGIKSKLYKQNPCYTSANDIGKCDFLGKLYKRLILCRYDLRTHQPEKVFEKYKIPSQMRNITRNKDNIWQAKASQCNRYPIKGGHDYTLFGQRFERWKKLVVDGIEDEVFRKLILDLQKLTPKEWTEHLLHYCGVEVKEAATTKQLRDLFDRILHCEHDLRVTHDATAEVFHRYRLPKSMYRLVEYQNKPYLLSTLTSSWFGDISPEAKEWADQMVIGKMVERPKCITWYIDHRCEATQEFSLFGQLKK